MRPPGSLRPRQAAARGSSHQDRLRRALDLPELVNRERRIRGTLHSLPTGRPIEVSGRIGGYENGAMGCRSNTHNAFRFAAGSMSGDIYARGEFTAMSQFVLQRIAHVNHRVRHRPDPMPGTPRWHAAVLLPRGCVGPRPRPCGLGDRQTRGIATPTKDQNRFLRPRTSAGSATIRPNQSAEAANPLPPGPRSGSSTLRLPATRRSSPSPAPLRPTGHIPGISVRSWRTINTESFSSVASERQAVPRGTTNGLERRRNGVFAEYGLTNVSARFLPA